MLRLVQSTDDTALYGTLRQPASIISKVCFVGYIKLHKGRCGRPEKSISWRVAARADHTLSGKEPCKPDVRSTMPATPFDARQLDGMAAEKSAVKFALQHTTPSQEQCPGS